MLEVGYAGGLRVSELVGLTWADVVTRGDDQVQLSVTGKVERNRTPDGKTERVVGAPFIDGDFGKTVRVLIPKGGP